ncbi:MAG: hypothetical protein DCC65_16365 [Planctomycetota bacterium]|nr:MAG: hypothetical protein DCC65_16365 [Planctomycetota bacterium]
MTRLLATILMLALVVSCPLVCRAMMPANDRGAKDAQIITQELPGDFDCCPGGEQERSTPADPCEGTSCFCSTFVTVDRAQTTAIERAVFSLFYDAIASTLVCFTPQVVDELIVDEPVSHVQAPGSSSILPLLI